MLSSPVTLILPQIFDEANDHSTEDCVADDPLRNSSDDGPTVYNEKGRSSPTSTYHRVLPDVLPSPRALRAVSISSEMQTGNPAAKHRAVPATSAALRLLFGCLRTISQGGRSHSHVPRVLGCASRRYAYIARVSRSGPRTRL